MKLNEDIKKILILGDSGFIGQRLRNYFTRRYPNKKVVGLSSKDIDLTNPDESNKLKGYFDDETLVIMTAGVKSNYGNNLDNYKKNVLMAETVCRALFTNPVKRFIFFSSIAVYGVFKHDTNISEDTSVLIDTPYALSKFDTEKLLELQFENMKDSSLVIVRLPTIYGPDEKIIASTPSGFLVKYLLEEEVTLWGDGSEIREFIFIDDLEKMIELLAFNGFSGIINLPSGNGHSYKEAIETISKLLGKKLSIGSKSRTKEKVDKIYDGKLFAKLFPDFKFTPLEDGLKLIMDNYNKKNLNSEEDSYKRDSCRLCNSKNLRLAVSVGSSPIGGNFVKKEQLDIKQKHYPLDLYQCKDCGHVQLLDIVNPELIFSEFSYFSGKTSLIKHFEDYANDIINSNNLSSNAFVVDVGSNDGAFLSFFKDKGMTVLGIDPAKNVAEYANNLGIETLPIMYDEKTSIEIRQKYGRADIITANNVFAHADDLQGMAKAVVNLLKEGGLFYFEVSYLIDVIDKMLIGTIFHEHLSYHSVKSLDKFLKKVGLELIDVKRIPIQGGSIICKAQILGGTLKPSENILELIKLEEAKGIYDQNYYDLFNDKLKKTKNDLKKIINEIKSRNKTIAAYGAARGGTLITYLFDLGKNIDYIVDDDPSKQGLYSPGYHIPVINTDGIYERNPDYVIILAWVHSNAIIDKNKKYLESGGKFITFFPKVRVVDKTTI